MNEITIEAFNKFAEQYADFTFTNILQYELNKFIALLPKQAKIIDLACGSGRDTNYFIEYEFEAVGIDASENMIKQAKRLVPEAEFKQMALESLKFPKSTFDAAWALDALSYVSKKDIPKVLTNINNILKPDSILFISVRLGKDEKEIEYEKLGKAKINVSFFAQKEIESLLSESGFEILNIYTQHGQDFQWINIYAKKK